MEHREITESSVPHKHKKQKHKKVKRIIPEEIVQTIIVAEDMSVSNKKSVTSIMKQQTIINNNKKRKKRDSATSSDEERWLSAIESGKLEDVDDELKKIKPKDPALMTARQRAMYDRGTDGSPSATAPTLMSLPTGYKEKIMTAEAIQKAAIKSQKRKQLADEKREKDKKKTMDRLLKKQESKLSKATKPKTTKHLVPTIIYKKTYDCNVLLFPKSIEFPMKAQKIKPPPSPKYCSMGCGNLKKYSCSQTKAPLCSLSCYKQNIANRIL